MTKGLAGWRITAWTGGAIAVMCTLLIGVFGVGEEGLRVLLRATARTSVLLFLGAYLASALREFSKSSATTWLRRNRRYLGVSFAISHTFHLAAIVLLGTGFDVDYDAVTLWAGGVAYVFVAAMTATSFDATAAWLGPRRWRRLHLVGLHYIWFVFLLTYLGNASHDVWAAMGVVALVLSLLLRVATSYRQARRNRR